MSDNFTPVQAQKFRLSGSGVTSSDTDIVLQSMLLPDGTTTIVMTDLGDIGFMTLEPGTSREEQISFTGITQNGDGTATLTGCLRGLRFVDPFDEVAANQKAHAGGTIAVLSNTAAFYGQLTAKDNDETITGIHTFTEPNVPRMSATHTYGVGEELYLATKEYVDGVGSSGAANASTTAKGIVEEATQAEVEAGTAAGATGARLFMGPQNYGAKWFIGYAADAGSNDTYAITLAPVPTAYAAGQLVLFKANTANTGACTLNVNSLGAKSLKYGGSDPRNGFITASAYVLVEYDGTNFNIINVSSRAEIGQDSREIYATSTGVGTAYAVALSPVISGYTAGLVVNFKPDATGGHPTLNVNSLGAKTILKNVTDIITVGDIRVNQPTSVIYDGTNFQLLSRSSNVGNKINFPAGVSVNNTTSETSIVSVSIPGGTLGTSAAIRVKAYVRSFATSNSSPDTITFRFKYGATTLISSTAFQPVSVALSTTVGFIEFLLRAEGATNSQSGTALIMTTSKGGQDPLANSNTVDTGTSSEDSTAAKTIAITAQWSGINTSTIELTGMTVERIS